jgi:hypothetical protein
MFIGKPLRKADVEFFPLDQLPEAKAWLAEQNAQSIFL